MDERRLKLLPVEQAETVASIIGTLSAAHRALAEYRRRREAGERVAIFEGVNDSCLYVGPLPNDVPYEDQEAIQ